MDHEVSLATVDGRPTAVVAVTTTWRQFPALWKELLDEVWACLRANGITSGCANVMLYLDDTPNVEVGVELRRPIDLSGRVVRSSLPAGLVATTVHRGSFTALGSAHDAIADWCRAHAHRPAGPRWEVYGPHSDDPSRIGVEVKWLVVPSP